MFELIADNSVLRLVLLIGLFGIVVALSFFGATAITARTESRRRLVEDMPGAPAHAMASGSLRAERAEGAWLALVNTIEKTGLSLVDTRSEALRQKLIAAGYTAPYAP